MSRAPISLVYEVQGVVVDFQVVYFSHELYCNNLMYLLAILFVGSSHCEVYLLVA